MLQIRSRAVNSLFSKLILSELICLDELPVDELCDGLLFVLRERCGPPWNMIISIHYVAIHRRSEGGEVNEKAVQLIHLVAKQSQPGFNRLGSR